VLREQEVLEHLIVFQDQEYLTLVVVEEEDLFLQEDLLVEVDLLAELEELDLEIALVQLEQLIQVEEVDQVDMHQDKQVVLEVQV
jgi:hypothetical protein